MSYRLHYVLFQWNRYHDRNQTGNFRIDIIDRHKKRFIIVIALGSVARQSHWQLTQPSTSFATGFTIPLALCARVISRRTVSLFLAVHCDVNAARPPLHWCGWRWLEKPERLYGPARARSCPSDVAHYTVIGPTALVTQPIDFRTLLLYYMLAIAITVDRHPRCASKNPSPMYQPLALPRSRRTSSVSWKLLYVYVFRPETATYVWRNYNWLSVAGYYYLGLARVLLRGILGVIKIEITA